MTMRFAHFDFLMQVESASEGKQICRNPPVGLSFKGEFSSCPPGHFHALGKKR